MNRIQILIGVCVLIAFVAGCGNGGGNLGRDMGSVCLSDNSCASGYCGVNDEGNFTACTDGSVGSGCRDDGDCASGYCGRDGTGIRVCADGSVGSRCDSHFDCASGRCRGDVCR